MTAIVQPAFRPDRPGSERPSLRLIEGGRSPRQVAQYRRRRVVAAVVLVTIAALMAVGVRAALPAFHPSVPGAHPLSSVEATGSGGPSVIVQHGDTLWSIARRLTPGGDVRAVVDRLAAVHGTGPLQAGERLPISAGKGG